MILYSPNVGKAGVLTFNFISNICDDVVFMAKLLKIVFLIELSLTFLKMLVDACISKLPSSAFENIKNP